METDEVMRQFDRLETKIASLIDQCKSLEDTNSELRQRVKELESELEEKVAAENQYSEQKALIRSKIDNLLAKLNDSSASRENQ
ncbi:MAG: cell division protein ZapB [Thermodesulfobacteriota bacterium]